MLRASPLVPKLNTLLVRLPRMAVAMVRVCSDKYIPPLLRDTKLLANRNSNVPCRQRGLDPFFVTASCLLHRAISYSFSSHCKHMFRFVPLPEELMQSPYSHSHGDTVGKVFFWKTVIFQYISAIKNKSLFCKDRKSFQ